MAKFRKVLSIVMVMCMFVSVLPMQALAAGSDPVITYEGELKVSTTTTNTDIGPTTTMEGDVKVTEEYHQTVIEFEVTAPDGQLVREGGSDVGSEIRIEEHPEEERVVENPAEVPNPTDPTVTTPELEVSFGDEGGKETASANGAQAPAEDENTEVKVEAGEGQTTITSTTTVVTNPNTSTTNTADPVVNADGSTTVVETKETVTTVTATTTETVVVTDRTLEAVLNHGAGSSTNDVAEELNADLGKFNAMLKDMGIIDVDLDEADAKAVLAALKGDQAELSESNAAIVAALNEKGDLTANGDAEKKAETPKIVVSDVTFKVGNETEEASQYYTSLSFQVLIENANAEDTTVSIYKGGEKIDSMPLSSIPVVDGKYVLSGLELSENQDYSLQFDFADQKDLVDAYVYNAEVKAPVTNLKVEGNVISGKDQNGNEVTFDAAAIQSTNPQIHGKDFFEELGAGFCVVSYVDENGVEHKFVAEVRNKGNDGLIVGAPEAGEDFGVVGKGSKGQLTFVHENGEKGIIEFERQDNGSGDKKGSAIFNFVRVIREFVYSFTSEATQDVSANDSFSINYSVNESTVESSSQSEVVETFKKTVTTTTTWDNKWEENYPYTPELINDNPPPVYRMTNNQLEEIPDEEVPLAAPVVTGDNSGILLIAIVMTMLMLVVINLPMAKRPRGKHEAI